jgi:hypothetical protein
MYLRRIGQKFTAGDMEERNAPNAVDTSRVEVFAYRYVMAVRASQYESIHRIKIERIFVICR